MKFIIYVLLFFFSLTLQIYPQSKNISTVSKVKSGNKKLSKDKPSAYITFEKYDEFTSDRTKKTYDIAWFLIHNNFGESISFCYYDLSVSPTGKIGLHYEVEKDLDFTDLSSRNNEFIPLGFPSYDMCNAYKLGSGKTFLFGIPQSHLTENTRFKVKFFYDWEDVYESFTGKEPEHYIYFRTISLPKIN